MNEECCGVDFILFLSVLRTHLGYTEEQRQPLSCERVALFHSFRFCCLFAVTLQSQMLSQAISSVLTGDRNPASAETGAALLLVSAEPQIPSERCWLYFARRWMQFYWPSRLL